LLPSSSPSFIMSSISSASSPPDITTQVVSGKPLSKLSCVCLPLGKLVNGKHFPSCIHSPMDTLSSSIYPSHNLTQLCDISMKGTHLLKNLALHIMNGLQSDRWSTQWTFFKGWLRLMWRHRWLIYISGSLSWT